MEVPIEIATECMSNYDSIMRNGEAARMLDSYSSSVSFKTSELASWLNNNNYLETTSQLKISFGIYTKNAAEAVGMPEYEGRLTTFIWPIMKSVDSNLGDDDKMPFNTGTLTP